NLERWCRLRGNLLFYFKSKDPLSEPIGVVVLEQCQQIAVFDGGLCQALASTCDMERSSWIDAIRIASYEGIRAELNALRQCIEHIAEVPICEVSLACDNLLCDGHGRPPNSYLDVDVYLSSAKCWIQYGQK
ncbi:PH domain containing protein, partial [Asbolus verrucosus]